MKRGGFTLVETLIVLAILVVLAAIAIGVQALVRRGNRKEVCRDHLLQIGRAFTAYEAKYHRYPTTGPKRWFRDLWEYGCVPDPGVFRCPYIRGEAPRTDYMGLSVSGTLSPAAGAAYTWTSSGITDGAPPDLPMACDGDTTEGPNHGVGEDVNVLFFQGRVYPFSIGSPSEGVYRGLLVPAALQWQAPAGTK